MTAGEQTILNILMQINNGLVQITKILKTMQKDGIPVVTQESRRP